MFDIFGKTLDAAIGKNREIHEEFGAVDEQISSTQRFLEERMLELMKTNKGEQETIRALIQSEFQKIRDKVEVTKESTEGILEPNIMSLPRSDSQVKALLFIANHHGGVTQGQIANYLDGEPKIINVLNRLRNRGLIDIKLQRGMDTYHITDVAKEFLRSVENGTN